MWQQSEKLEAALRGGGQVATELEFLQSDEPVAVFTSLIVDGTVTAERSMVRRSVDLTIIDADNTLTPTDATDLFAPWGRYELRVKRGMAFPDGTVEVVPLGQFRIEEIDGQWPRLTVRGFDRMHQISLNRFTTPYSVTAGTLLNTAVGDLVTDRWGRDLDMLLLEHDEAAPTLVFDEQGDPAEALEQLATACGCSIFFDQIGRLVMVEEPDLFAERPVWRFVEGEDGTTLLSGLARRTVTEGAYNGVIAVGEALDDTPPVRGEWWDTNPASPTYVGAFGRRPRFYASPLLTTNAQAASAARKVGLASLGLPDSIGYQSLVVPGLDVGDVVYVERLAQGVADNHVLDQVSTQLRAQGSQNLQTRAAVVSEL